MTQPDNWPAGNQDQRVSDAVVRAVADRAGKMPTELPEMYGVIDPDALDAIFQPLDDGTPRPGGSVELEYAGYLVRISMEGGIEVTVSSTA